LKGHGSLLGAGGQWGRSGCGKNPSGRIEFSVIPALGKSNARSGADTVLRFSRFTDLPQETANRFSSKRLNVNV
jgi:hypothetical protein